MNTKGNIKGLGKKEKERTMKWKEKGNDKERGNQEGKDDGQKYERDGKEKEKGMEEERKYERGNNSNISKR